jgi:peptidoglycan L-alanyl-D-glutamate endopeptidase CwlK
MPSRDKKDLNPILTQVYDKACEEYLRLYPDFPQPFITCTFRSGEEQNKLYALGRTEKGKIVTNAKAGQSAHNTYPSNAFDIAFITLSKALSWDDKHFIRFAEIVKKISKDVDCGCYWHFKDSPHFELKK